MSCGAHGAVSLDVFTAATKSGSFSCTWPDNYLAEAVSATVTDDDLGTDTDTIHVDVANVAPDVTLTGPNTANEGQTVAYTYTFTDPGTDTWTHAVSCGAHGAVSLDVFTATTKSGSFSCTWPDNYLAEAVSATVTDDDLGTDTDTIHVDVANVAPDVTLTGPNTANEGQTVAYTYTFTDPGTDTWTHRGELRRSRHGFPGRLHRRDEVGQLQLHLAGQLPRRGRFGDGYRRRPWD